MKPATMPQFAPHAGYARLDAISRGDAIVVSLPGRIVGIGWAGRCRA